MGGDGAHIYLYLYTYIFSSTLDLDLYIEIYTYIYDVIENGVCDTMKAFVWEATVSIYNYISILTYLDLDLCIDICTYVYHVISRSRSIYWSIYVCLRCHRERSLRHDEGLRLESDGDCSILTLVHPLTRAYTYLYIYAYISRSWKYAPMYMASLGGDGAHINLQHI